MERKKQFLGSIDILRGVGELVVDEAKLVFHAIFRMPHQLSSHGDHLPKDSPAHPDWVDVPNPIHLNKYEDGGYDDMGNYYDGDDPEVA